MQGLHTSSTRYPRNRGGGGTAAVGGGGGHGGGSGAATGFFIAFTVALLVFWVGYHTGSTSESARTVESEASLHHREEALRSQMQACSEREDLIHSAKQKLKGAEASLEDENKKLKVKNDELFTENTAYQSDKYKCEEERDTQRKQWDEEDQVHSKVISGLKKEVKDSELELHRLTEGRGSKQVLLIEALKRQRSLYNQYKKKIQQKELGVGEAIASSRINMTEVDELLLSKYSVELAHKEKIEEALKETELREEMASIVPWVFNATKGSSDLEMVFFLGRRDADHDIVRPKYFHHVGSPPLLELAAAGAGGGGGGQRQQDTLVKPPHSTFVSRFRTLMDYAVCAYGANTSDLVMPDEYSWRGGKSGFTIHTTLAPAIKPNSAAPTSPPQAIVTTIHPADAVQAGGGGGGGGSTPTIASSTKTEKGEKKASSSPSSSSSETRTSNAAAVPNTARKTLSTTSEEAVIDTKKTDGAGAGDTHSIPPPHTSSSGDGGIRRWKTHHRHQQQQQQQLQSRRRGDDSIQKDDDTRPSSATDNSLPASSSELQKRTRRRAGKTLEKSQGSHRSDATEKREEDPKNSGSDATTQSHRKKKKNAEHTHHEEDTHHNNQRGGGGEAVGGASGAAAAGGGAVVVDEKIARSSMWEEVDTPLITFCKNCFSRHSTQEFRLACHDYMDEGNYGKLEWWAARSLVRFKPSVESDADHFYEDHNMKPGHTLVLVPYYGAPCPCGAGM